MLCARVGGLGERCEEGFDARPLDVVECAGEDGLAAAGADRRSEDDLFLSFISFRYTARDTKDIPS